ncbi:hypothetical protein [Amycolatopsis sp.]|jgi:hypothetical protein|nr:hypothetical protein [Amycolatopsis sp.]
MTANTNEKVKTDDVDESPEVETPVVRPNGNTDPHTPPPNP